MSEQAEELDDTERTTEELQEILSEGGTVWAHITANLSYSVSLADVCVNFALTQKAIDATLRGVSRTLAEGEGDFPLVLDPAADDEGADQGGVALLERLLTARASLLGA